MKAAVVNKFGGYEALEYQDVPTPESGPDDVLIKIEGSGPQPRRSRHPAPVRAATLSKTCR